MGGSQSKKDLDAKTHYNTYHRGKPHEAFLSGINPQTQQKVMEKNHAAYLWLYMGIAFALVLLLLMGLGLYLDYRRKSKERHAKEKERKEAEENTKLYSQIGKTSDYGGSVTTTTEEIQPKPSVSNYEQLNRRPSGFAGFNTHHQQPPQNHNISSSENNLQDLSTPSYGSSNPNLDQNPNLRRQSRQVSHVESFPYEYYGMPMEDREPIRTRVADLGEPKNLYRLSAYGDLDEEMSDTDEGGLLPQFSFEDNGQQNRNQGQAYYETTTGGDNSRENQATLPLRRDGPPPSAPGAAGPSTTYFPQ